MVLYEGYQIFFGPIDVAESYFTGLGFVRPSRATTPDFLTSLTNPPERLVRRGYENRVPRSAEEFAQAWKSSDEAQALRAEIEAFDNAYRHETRFLNSQKANSDKPRCVS